eukprot:SAG31_NODE_17171_length_680_cov_1.378657_1_plen_44_part_10
MLLPRRLLVSMLLFNAAFLVSMLSSMGGERWGGERLLLRKLGRW